jgi:hypothetical protein
MLVAAQDGAGTSATVTVLIEQMLALALSTTAAARYPSEGTFPVQLCFLCGLARSKIMTRKRLGFTPEALSALDLTIDEVREELLGDGVFSRAVMDSRLMRTQLAQKGLAFASAGWGDIQIRQLLLRAFRNAASSRDCRPRRRGQ